MDSINVLVREIETMWASMKQNLDKRQELDGRGLHDMHVHMLISGLADIWETLHTLEDCVK